MTIAFQCPACKATRNAPDIMAGRRVRCPECDALVEVIPLPEGPSDDHADLEDDARGTVQLQPAESPAGDTVMLEEVDTLPLSGLTPMPRMSGPPRKPPASPKKQEPDDEPPQIKKSKLVETEMDMTPMVDATFQLLIFFMITAAFALQKSKEIPKPTSEEASTNVVQQQEEENTNAVVVRIDEFDSYLVINADGDEEEAPSVLDLHTKLRKAHDGDSEGRIPTLLRVEAHDEATNGRVITAIDAGNAAGFAEVQLASISEDA